MANNIFKIILNDDNVNDYTKLYLILYQMSYYKRYYIPNKLIANRLKIDVKLCPRLLNKFKEKGIIKIYYIGKKRYFRFINEIDRKDINYDDLDYNWLEDI